MTDLVSERMAALLASPREHEGVRVVTFADVDEMHERPKGTAARNFAENISRFTEGRDFFRVSPNARNVESANQWASGAREVIYLTERGYTKLTKPMRDDRAWGVFDTLTDVYFDSRSIVERTLAGVLAEVSQLRAEVAHERADRMAAQADRFAAAHALRVARSNAASTLGAPISPRLRVLGEEDPKQTNLAYRSFEELIEDRAKARGDGRITSTEAAALLGCSVRELGKRVKAGRVVRRHTGTRRAYSIDDVRAALAPAVAS